MIRMPLHSKTSLALSIIAALGVAGSAHAQTYATTVVAPSTQQVAQFSTTTTASSPTFDRGTVGRPGVTAATGAVSGLGNAVAYSNTNTLTNSTSSYLATASGSYTVQTSENYGVDANPLSDYLQSIYTTAFIPTSGATNLLQSYSPTAVPNSNYNVNLTAGTNYIFVDHGYYNAVDFAAKPADGASFGTANTTVFYNNPGSRTTVTDPFVVAGTGATATGTLVVTPSPQTLTVTDTTVINSFNGITIVGLQHPFIGDLLGTLSHNGVTVDLFDHTNASASNYNQGSSAKFDGGNYTFSLSGADLSAVPDNTVAPDGTYKASSNPTSGFDTMNTANTLNSFIGQSVAGAWTLTLTDEQPDDTGSFLGFNFTVNQPAAAPEPSQYVAFGIGLLGLGALALRARRRKTA